MPESHAIIDGEVNPRLMSALLLETTKLLLVPLFPATVYEILCTVNSFIDLKFFLSRKPKIAVA